MKDGRTKIRKEIHSRQSFAYDRGTFWLNQINKQSIVKTGNVFSSRPTKKFLQARRIYIHYTNEFQRNQLLPLSK